MKRFHSQIGFVGLIAAALCAGPVRSAPADIYVLANDGQLRGELVNTDESPRQKFVIRTPDGATVTLDRAQVKQIIPQSAAELEFEKIRPTYADTAEDQWRLAEWCREKSLTRQRQAVLEHVIELNPEMRQARLALGYQQIDGRWMQKEQIMQEQGYVRYKGGWALPQEIELIENRQKDEGAERLWVNNLKRWRTWLDDSARADQARDSLLSIHDPYAVQALQQALNTERNRDVRKLYVRALAGCGAVKALVAHSLDDPDEEIRLACLDQLTANPQPDAVSIYVAALKSQDNTRINRAAYSLGKLRDKSAIGPLIDSLVTTHKFTVVEGSGNPNSINAGFSPQGGVGGLSVGSSTKVVHRNLTNQQVLDALVSLTGGVNLNFDEKAWKNWYASQKKQTTMDVRRD